jgi:hypothetical protein
VHYVLLHVRPHVQGVRENFLAIYVGTFEDTWSFSYVLLQVMLVVVFALELFTTVAAREAID